MSKDLLIIEDNPENMYLMTYMLTSAGYTVHCAETGSRGIQMATELLPCAILLDIQLPKMDGYEVARELKKIPDISHIPIIAVTSYAMVGDKEKALTSGASGYIEKPINPDTFVAEMEYYIHKKHISTEGEAHENSYS